ncbi:MAG: hypothetical protein DCC67_10440 [Planctomycetota bacterium]|nr:MAG: hypothetical protein DCC67_10440 [Planctomycetota bacterium]
MAHPISFLKGVCCGAGLMYFMDPERGRRRRSLLRDQCVHYCHKATRAAEVVRRDAQNRLQGTVAEFRHAFQHDEPADDVLTARVRAKIGRYVSHPSAIDVDASGGRITMFGSVLARELDGLLAAVRSVRGVGEVQSALRVHDDAGATPDLQGGVERRGERYDLMQEYWSPTSRSVLGAAGLGLMATCLGRRTPSSMLLGTLGLMLTSRAMTNLDTFKLLGLGGRRRGINVQTGLVINAPIEKVFELLSDPQNYSRLSDSIESVEDLGDGRYHKTVRLPGGAEAMLSERIVSVQPNELVRWRSEPDSFVPYAGAAWFNKLDDNRTEVQVCMSYNPPGGVFSHLAASAAHMNPKMLMDEVLMRTKQHLEGSQPSREEGGERTGAAASTGGHPAGSEPQGSPRVEGASSPAQAGEPVIHNL